MNLVQKTKLNNALFFFSNFFLVNSFSMVTSCSFVSNYEKNILVTNVVDGDTFKSYDKSYRILGIDTPETFDSSNNFENTVGARFLYGSIAKNETKKYLNNKNIDVEILKKDKYERYITKITLNNGIDFASHMIKNGYAVVRYISPIKNNYFYYYDKSYINTLYELQEFAKENKRGFWSESKQTITEIFPGFDII